MVFAVQPLIPLSPQVVHINRACHTQHHPYKDITLPTQVRVPNIWYGVIAVSEGITQLFNQRVGCLPNLREMMTQVQMSHIEDPHLQQSIDQFPQQCFLPARAHWLQYSHRPGASNDTDWLGSSVLMNTPGFYDALYAHQAVHGFPFDPERDWTHAQGDQKPLWGRPRCDHWWRTKNTGLRSQLIELLPSRFWQGFNSIFLPEATDDALKALLNHHPWGYKPANSMVGDWGYSHASEMVGAEISRLESYPKLYALQQAAPLIRALLLLAIYAFLPFMLVFSAYRVKTLVLGSLFIFSVIFFAAIWHFIEGVDDALIKALYIHQIFAQTPQAVLADSIIGGMMIMMPFFWFTLMSAFGVALNSGMDRYVGGLFSAAETMAGKGARAASQVIKNTAGIAKKIGEL
jgi:hypothetical protein